MSNKNNQFVIDQFDFLEKLEDNDSDDSWAEQYEDNYHDYYESRPIGNKPFTTESLKIPFINLITDCENIGIKCIDKIESEYNGSYPIYIPESNITGFGSSLEGCIIFSKTKNNIIDHIWLEGNFNNKIIEILYHIGLKYEMILIDWISREIIDLTDKNSIRQFITE